MKKSSKDLEKDEEMTETEEEAEESEEEPETKEEISDEPAEEAEEEPRSKEFRRDRGPRRDFRSGSGGFRGGFRGGSGGFRQRNFGPREMHKATCSECGKECEVPFKPTKGKPVYCKECFMKRRRY